MRLQLVGLFAALLSMAADAPKEDVEKELGKLQGKWRLVGLEESKKEEIDFDKAPILPIKDDRLKDVPYEGKKLEMLIELDPSQKPKAINLTYISPDGKSKGDSFLAIYALEGDTLRICFTPKEKGAKRPKEFATKGEGAGLFMWTLKRDKP